MSSLADSALELRVYLEDTDAGGIVYHASYLRFMERARTELLRACGLEQSSTFQRDLSFVVHSMSLRFVRAARLDDRLRVSCRVSELRPASVRFKQDIGWVGSAELCVQAEVTVACIALATGRARRIPPELAGALSAPNQ